MKATPPDVRRQVLEIAQELGNVAEACRQTGVTRTQYYQYLRRVRSFGDAGLHVEARPGPSSRALDASCRQTILRCALANPHLTVPRLQALLAVEGVGVSAPTIRKVLAAEQLGSARDRWCELERRLALGETLDANQMAFVERWNPCIALRDTIPALPGALIYQDCIAMPGSRGPRFLHLAVDAATMRAFGSIQGLKSPEAAIVLLHKQVFPTLEAVTPEPPMIVTSRSSVFAGKPSHLYRVFLDLFSVRQVTVPRADRRALAPAMRFAATVRDEFLTSKKDDSLEPREAAADRFRHWLADYNRTPQPGFPNYGRAPLASWSTEGST